MSSTGASGASTTTSDVTQPAVGVVGTLGLGVVSVEEGASVTVSGVQAAGQSGGVLVWSKIVPVHNSNWAGISPTSSESWAPVNTNSTVTWKKIAS